MSLVDVQISIGFRCKIFVAVEALDGFPPDVNSLDVIRGLLVAGELLLADAAGRFFGRRVKLY